MDKNLFVKKPQSFRPGYLLVCIIFGVFLLNPSFCQPVPLKIGLSKASPNYVNWLKRVDPSVKTIDLYKLTKAMAIQQLSQCSGLILTGGEDVYPGRYGQESDTSRCTEMNPARDSLDIALIEKALRLKMPVLGICRGHQILNVYFGGTLVIDIPVDIGKKVVHQCDDYLNCFHDVNVRTKTVLATITKCKTAVVTTNHHQAVLRLAPDLTANVYSDDRLVEGIEWRNPDGKSFLLGVQWHPERMDKSNPLSSAIANEFMLQALKFSGKHE
jgi:putative glutamine amidotransferase